MAGARGRGQALADGLAGAQVGEHDGAGAGAAGLDGHADDVAGGERDAAKVDGIVGEPLVPRVVRVGAVAVHRPVDAGLQDRVAVRVAVDADPGGAGTGAGGVWDGELARDGVEGLTWGRCHVSVSDFNRLFMMHGDMCSDCDYRVGSG